MNIFKGQNLLEFAERFKKDETAKNTLEKSNGRRVIYVGNAKTTPFS